GQAFDSSILNSTRYFSYSLNGRIEGLTPCSEFLAEDSNAPGLFQEFSRPKHRIWNNMTGHRLRSIWTNTCCQILLAIPLLLASCQRQPVVITTSDSPDGKHQCVVTERSPRWPKGSPFIYTFTIREKATNKDLSGEPGTYNSDSAAIRNLEFT